VVRAGTHSTEPGTSGRVAGRWSSRRYRPGFPVRLREVAKNLRARRDPPAAAERHGCRGNDWRSHHRRVLL